MLAVFKSVIKELNYIAMCIRYNVKQSISNTKSFIIQTIAMFINNFVFLLFWKLLFNNKGGSINGTTMQDLWYLWSVPTIAYGICFFCFGGINSLAQDIAEGNLDIYLAKPKHSLISALTSRSVLSAMGDILFGVFAGIIATGGNVIKMLFVFLVSFIASIAFLGVMIIIRVLAFWFGDVSDVCNKYTNSLLITLTIYPEQMFPKFIKVAMFTVIPAMYVAHIPVRIVKSFSIYWFLLLIIVTVMFLTVAFKLYGAGLKKYESGNNVTKR